MTPLILIAIIIPIVAVILGGLDFASKLGYIRRAAFIRHISFIVRRNLPLVSALFVSSIRQPANVRIPMRRLSRLLELGIPLSDAIGMAWPKCPRVDRSILQAAEQSGTLPDAITILDERYQHDFEVRLDQSQPTLALPILTFGMFITWFLLATAFFIPRVNMIGYDFGTSAPLFTQEILMSGFGTGALPTTWYGTLFHATAAAILILGGLWFIAQLLGASLRRADFYNNFCDSLRWFIPVSRRAEIARSCLFTLPTIRVTTAAGWPLDRAIDMAATVKVNFLWRQRLQDWADAIRAGKDTVLAGRAVGLPESLLRYLAVGVRDGSLEAPLYSAERYFQLLLERQQRAVRMAVSITATMVVGALGACACVALILMLAEVIDAAAATWWEI